MSKWTRQLLYVRRDAQGVIVGIQEARPDSYKEPQEETLRKAVRRSNEIKRGKIGD